MVKVVLWGGIADFADGQSEFELDAPTIHKLFQQLGEQFPGLKPELDQNVSVSIDGRIYRDSIFVPIDEGAEVLILPKLQGG